MSTLKYRHLFVRKTLKTVPLDSFLFVVIWVGELIVVFSCCLACFAKIVLQYAAQTLCNLKLTWHPTITGMKISHIPMCSSCIIYTH